MRVNPLAVSVYPIGFKIGSWPRPYPSSIGCCIPHETGAPKNPEDASQSFKRFTSRGSSRNRAAQTRSGYQDVTTTEGSRHPYYLHCPHRTRSSSWPLPDVCNTSVSCKQLCNRQQLFANQLDNSQDFRGPFTYASLVVLHTVAAHASWPQVLQRRYTSSSGSCNHGS